MKKPLNKKTRNFIILFSVTAVICIGVGIVFLLIQARQAGGWADLVLLAFLVTSYIVFHILAGLSLTFIILSAKNKNKKKLVCIVACLGIFIVAYVFCSDHTAFVQYNLENEYGIVSDTLIPFCTPAWIEFTLLTPPVIIVYGILRIYDYLKNRAYREKSR